MHFTAIPLKNLLRRPGRSLFGAIGIALATGTFLAMTVLFGGLVERWREGMSAVGIHAFIVQDRQVDWLASAIPQALADDVASIPGVHAAEPELVVFLSGPMGTSLLVSGWRDSSVLLRSLDLVKGSADLAILPTAVQPALIGAPLAQTLGLDLGAQISLDGLDVTITGIFAGSDALMSSRIILPIAALQEHMFRQGSATFVHVMFTDPSDQATLPRVTALLDSGYPSLAIRNTAEFAQDSRMVALLRTLSDVAIWMVAIVGAAGTANIMLMAANERRGEIGLLLALGWAPTRIIALFLIEALVLAVVAGVLGVLLGLGMVAAVKSSVTLALFLSGSVSIGAISKALALAIGIGTVAGIAPAVRVLRIAPDETLRAI